MMNEQKIAIQNFQTNLHPVGIHTALGLDVSWLPQGVCGSQMENFTQFLIKGIKKLKKLKERKHFKNVEGQ